jgi:hypothetical protein
MDLDIAPGPGVSVPEAVHEARMASAEPVVGPVGLTTAHLHCPTCGLDRYEWVAALRPDLVPPCPCGDLPDLVTVAA